MKIEFGGGKSPRKKDWLQCDIQDLDNIDIVCNAWEICDHIENNVVEEIYSRVWNYRHCYYSCASRY